MTKAEFDRLPSEARENISEIERIILSLVIDIGIPRVADLLDTMAENVRVAKIV